MALGVRRRGPRRRVDEEPFAGAVTPPPPGAKAAPAPPPDPYATTPTNARGQAIVAFEAGRFDDAARLARIGQTFPPDWARSTFVLATALAKTGALADARAETRALAARWLDDAPAPAPAVHPRVVVSKDELLTLVRAALDDAAEAGALVARVCAAGDAPMAAGDFL